MKDIELYDRVTDALFFISGLCKISPEILKNACDRGSKVHEICDSLINNLGIWDLDLATEGYIDSFKQWLPGKKFIGKAERFFCDQLMLTGECDAIYDSPEGLVLVDFKTPSKESKTWRLQGSAYSWLAKKSGYPIKKIEFVKLSKIGKPPKSYWYEEDFETYLKCLEIYRLFFKNCENDINLEWI
jgi:hypothetical protein